MDNTPFSLPFRWRVLWAGMLFLALSVGSAACSPQATPSLAPPPTSAPVDPAATATSVPADQPTATPAATATLPPEATATAAPTDAPPTDTPAPTATPTPQFRSLPVAGIEVHNLWGVERSVDAGVYWIRRNALRWDVIEPIEGERNWAAVATLEQEMVAIAEQGMEMILIIHYTPYWARALPGYGCGPVATEKLEAFGAFMRDVVARYSQPPYSVQYYEMGNEPDVPYQFVAGDSQFGCWIDMEAPLLNAGAYADMLKAVYPQVKAANAEAQVLVGGLLLDCDPHDPPQNADGSLKDCSPSRFLEYILQVGAADAFDGVSFHAYDYYGGASGIFGNGNWHSAWNTTGPALAAKARYLRALLDYYNRPDAYLINTETALICGRSGSEAPCITDEFAQTKASYAVQSYAMALAEGLLGNVWYSINGWRASGLVNRGGEPLPVYQAIRFQGQLLNDLGFVGRLTPAEGVTGYEFRRDGRRVWLLWTQDDQEHLLALPSAPLAAYDMLGNALPPVAEWLVTPWPVYLEWQE